MRHIVQWRRKRLEQGESFNLSHTWWEYFVCSSDRVRANVSHVMTNGAAQQMVHEKIHCRWLNQMKLFVWMWHLAGCQVFEWVDDETNQEVRTSECITRWVHREVNHMWRTPTEGMRNRIAISWSLTFVHRQWRQNRPATDRENDTSAEATFYYSPAHLTTVERHHLPLHHRSSAHRCWPQCIHRRGAFGASLQSSTTLLRAYRTNSDGLCDVDRRSNDLH